MGYQRKCFRSARGGRNSDVQCPGGRLRFACGIGYFLYWNTARDLTQFSSALLTEHRRRLLLLSNLPFSRLFNHLIRCASLGRATGKFFVLSLKPLSADDV